MRRIIATKGRSCEAVGLISTRASYANGSELNSAPKLARKKAFVVLAFVAADVPTMRLANCQKATGTAMHVAIVDYMRHVCNVSTTLTIGIVRRYFTP